MVLGKWIAKKQVCVLWKRCSDNVILAVAVPTPLGHTTSSASTSTQLAAPTPCPVSSRQKTSTATLTNGLASSLPLGLPMSSIHMGATLASVMDMTSPMTLSTPVPGTESPITSYPMEWETAHVCLATVHGWPLKTACQSRPFRR